MVRKTTLRLVGIELITGGSGPARPIGRTSPLRGDTPGGPWGTAGPGVAAVVPAARDGAVVAGAALGPEAQAVASVTTLRARTNRVIELRNVNSGPPHMPHHLATSATQHESAIWQVLPLSEWSWLLRVAA
jgi:hypothetical protein